MKKLLTILFSAANIFCLAQKTVSVEATLTHATVYYANGAELEHSAKAILLAGSQELIINNISQSVDVNTIQVACPENITILSYRFNTFMRVPDRVTDVLVNKMQDSVQQLKKQIQIIENDYSIQNEILQKTSLLIQTNFADQEKTINAAELLKLIDYYNQKILVIKSGLFAFTQKKEFLTDSIAHISYRISERNTMVTPPPSKLIGQLVMQVIAQAAGNTDFSFSYFTKNAGWLPSYDLRVKSIDNSFKLVYKASVHQSTGIDWKQVKLSLTTGNPNQSTTSPVLNPWFVALYVPQVAMSLNEVVVVGYGSAKKLSEDSEDTENFKPINDKYKEDDSALEGNLVKAYASLSESQLNVNFDIDLPYDILPDGKAVSVGIKDEMIKAAYKHVCVPKLDYDAFLLAEISDWESLNLMPGEANIIMDNVYLGKSFIDPNTTADTLTVSLGRDKRISVTRTLVREFSKSKVRGDNKVDEYTYELVVKNNKVKAADIVLKDHLPVSKVKDVEVTITDKGTAELNDETGMLTWKIKLEPGESRKFRFSYSVKYPKDKKIVNL